MTNPLTELLAKCEAWTADAAMAMHSLSVRRAALLKEAKRLKMVAACKAILVAPKMGGEEPVAAEAPAAHHVTTAVQFSPPTPTIPPYEGSPDIEGDSGHQSGPLAIPKELKR